VCSSLHLAKSREQQDKILLRDANSSILHANNELLFSGIVADLDNDVATHSELISILHQVDQHLFEPSFVSDQPMR